jgi:hypothetical protein
MFTKSLRKRVENLPVTSAFLSPKEGVHRNLRIFNIFIIYKYINSFET